MSTETVISRGAEIATLERSLTEARGGTPQLVVIEGEEGSGRRTVVTTALKNSGEGILPLRAHFIEGEDGLRVLLRLYAGLFGALHRDATLKASVETYLAEQAVEKASDERMGQWIKAFQEGLAKEAPQSDSPTFQVTIPRASPFLGLMELLILLSRRFTILLELGDSHNVLSFPFWAFTHAMMARISRDKAPVCVVMWHPRQATDEEGAPVLLRQLLAGVPADIGQTEIQLPLFTQDQLGELASSRHPGLSLNGDQLARLEEVSGGRPGWACQVLDRLAEQKRLATNGDGKWKLEGDSSAFDPASLLPAFPAADDARLRRVLQVAALEGRTFTSTVIADVLDLKKDEVEDLLDDLDEHIREVVHHEALGCYLYRFNSALLHRQLAASISPHARAEQARTLAELLERKYVPRAGEMAFKGARLWREAGEPRRAANLLGLITAMERPDLLQMGYEIFRVDIHAGYGAMVVRGLHLSLAEKLSGNGPVQLGMEVMNSLAFWASENKVEDLAPWIAFYRGRFLQRANQPAEAAKFADEARSGFARQKNAIKEAESLNLLASIELGRGELGKVMEYSQRVLGLSQFIPVVAQARFMKGLVHKGRGELQPAVEDLKAALDSSAKVGNLALHADAGLNLAETLLMGNNAPAAEGLLNQLLQLTRQQKMQPRERGALSLLAKTYGAMKDLPRARANASEALKLARSLKNRLAEGADLFDLGLFSYQDGDLDEAQIYLKEAEAAVREVAFPPLMTEILFHLGLVASANEDLDRALVYYLEAEKFCRQVGNERRLANILFNTAAIYLHQDKIGEARTYLEQSRPLVEKYGTDQDKKALRKASRKLEDKLH